MRQIVIIGKLNPLTQNLHSYLSKYFQVQLCSDAPDVAKSIIKMCKPDIILINMQDMTKIHTIIFNELRNNYKATPVLYFGTETEIEMVEEYTGSFQFEMIPLPVDSFNILSRICARLSLDIQTMLKDQVDVDSQEIYLNKKNILVIDDDPVQLRSTRKLLQSKYNISLATSGAEGLTIIGRSMPDLILLDYDMPVCNGRQTLEMIRNLKGAENIPVIFLTGVSDREHIESVIRLKPAGYLLKPAESAKLISLIREILNEDTLY